MVKKSPAQSAVCKLEEMVDEKIKANSSTRLCVQGLANMYYKGNTKFWNIANHMEKSSFEIRYLNITKHMMFVKCLTRYKPENKLN